MGCWNGTCGISQLPILSGDRVFGLLIAVPHKPIECPSGSCYETEFGFPISLPFRGNYNDYGGMENIEENKNTKAIFNEFAPKDCENFEQLINDIVERDELTKDLEYYGECGVGLFMVLEDVIKELMNAKSDNSFQAVEISRELHTKMAEAFKERYFKTKKDLGDIWPKFSYSVWDPYYSSKDEEYKTLGYVNSFLSPLHKGSTVGNYYDYIKAVMGNIINSNENDKFQQFTEITYWAYCIRRSIAYLRKSYIPNAGKGSQSTGHDFYIKLAKAIRDVVKKQKRRYK